MGGGIQRGLKITQSRMVLLSYLSVSGCWLCRFVCQGTGHFCCTVLSFYCCCWMVVCLALDVEFHIASVVFLLTSVVFELLMRLFPCFCLVHVSFVLICCWCCHHFPMIPLVSLSLLVVASSYLVTSLLVISGHVVTTCITVQPLGEVMDCCPFMTIGHMNIMQPAWTNYSKHIQGASSSWVNNSWEDWSLKRFGIDRSKWWNITEINSSAATQGLFSEVIFVLALLTPFMFAFILSMIAVASCLLIVSVCCCLYEGSCSTCCRFSSCFMLSDLIYTLICLASIVSCWCYWWSCRVLLIVRHAWQIQPRRGHSRA